MMNHLICLFQVVMVLNSVASDTLKNLYLYRNGENKGFVKLIKQKELDKTYDERFIEFMKSAIDGANAELIQELYNLCCKSDVSAEIKEIVKQLYELNCGVVNE